eukprot:Pgem_evm1s20115
MSDTSKASSSNCNPTTSHPSISIESVSKFTPIIFNGDHNSFRRIYAPTVALDGFDDSAITNSKEFIKQTAMALFKVFFNSLVQFIN